jgi:hypothetical protein
MKSISIWLAVISFTMGFGARAQWQRQTIRLNPGWNAVYLEVQPEPSDVDSVLGGLPIESAWIWDRPGQVVEFVDDPEKLVPGKPEWLAYVPTNHPHAAARNLFEIPGGRALLVNLATNRPVDWPVVGRPAFPKYQWVGDSYNLVGFPLENGARHTFSSLLGAIPAHASLLVLKLGSNGVWSRVASPQTELVEPGRAYWIYSRGVSQFAGPLEVATGQGSRLAFGDAGVLNALRLGNPGANALTYWLVPQAAVAVAEVAGQVPLKYRRFAVDAVSGVGTVEWRDWTNRLEVTVPAGEAVSIQIEARRAELDPPPTANARDYHSLLSVTDTNGYRMMIPLSLRTDAGLSKASNGKIARTAPTDGTHPRAGLWVGNVILTDVNFTAHPSDPGKLRPAKSEFDFRILVHVDDGGQARLLQRAMVMWRRTNDMTSTGRLVVATDERLATRLGLTGVSVRNEQPVVRRFSAPTFAFREPILMDAEGEFGNGTLRCSTVTGYNDPLSPFKHVWHSDHDNLDPTDRTQILAEGVESFSVQRSIELRFTADDPTMGTVANAQYVPGFGDTRLGGTYQETLAGVHRRPVRMGGTFTLQRTVAVGLLNDGETN